MVSLILFLVAMGVVTWIWNIGFAVFISLGAFLIWTNHPEEEESTLPKT